MSGTLIIKPFRADLTKDTDTWGKMVFNKLTKGPLCHY